MAQEWTGRCFCGDVEIVVRGAPAAMGYCHCASCRHWSAGPINAFTLWKTSAVEVVRGEDRLGEFQKSPRSLRRFCKSCGGHVLTAHPHWDLIDVYAAVIPEFPFEPKVHVNYAERVVAVRDGLPKLVDLPAEMGGTGRATAE